MKNSPMPPRAEPMRRGKQLARTRPLKPVSARRAAENRQRSAMVAETWPERPPCTVTRRRVAAGMEPLAGCAGRADDVHEVLTRGRGGSITNPQNCVTPCRPCHDVLTFTPDSDLWWAYELGLLAHSWGGAT